MATLNFPDSPDTGDIYFDSNSGFTYEWNAAESLWISRDPSTIPNIKELDNISSSFNGSTTTFNLTVSSVAVSPANAQQLVINIGNVMQNPGDDYTVSGSTITFTTAPLAGYVFQGTVLGSGVSLGTVVDGSVSPASLDTSDSYNVGGITVTGIATVNDFSFSGITTVANLKPADVKVIGGISTVSNVLMTKDASGLGATVGAAVGVITYFGDGSNLTGVGLSMFPLSYDPGISSTSIPIDTNISVDWNHPVKAGSGTITIRTGSVSGTIVDQFVVGTSSSIRFSSNKVILNPAADLDHITTYYVVYPAGSIKSYGDQFENAALSFSFTTAAQSRYLFTSGLDSNGQMGQNTAGYPAARSSPTLVGTSNTWVKGIASFQGPTASFYTKNDGTLWAWGSNPSGGLGLNDVTSRSSPTQIPGTTWGSATWNTGAVHENSTYVVKTDGTLWAWGSNDKGQLGHNDVVKYSSPVQVPGTWAQSTSQLTTNTISTSYSEGIMAIKANGTLWAWGENEWGNLGLNQAEAQIANISSPAQIGTDTTWRAVAYGLATKTDGTLWAWGRNYSGQCAQNTANPGVEGYSSPTQIPGTNWGSINGSFNAFNKSAIKTDGTLWAWGSNPATRGMLGLNDTIDRSSPTQVGTDTTWSEVNNGTTSTKAIKTDGTYWFWGENNWGEVGASNPNWGYQTRRSSPVLIGSGDSWPYGSGPQTNFVLEGGIYNTSYGTGWLRTSLD